MGYKKSFTKKEDLKLKEKYFKKFCNEIKNGKMKTVYHLMAWLAWNNYVVCSYLKKENITFNEFEKQNEQRIIKGSKKYKADWVYKDCLKEASEEIADQFNYSFFGWLQHKNNRGELKI